MSASSPVALRWLRRRMEVAYVLCPVVTLLVMALGLGHRVPAIVLMSTVVFGTNAYVIACALWALLLVPTNRSGTPGPLWDDTPLAALLALPLVLALAKFTDEPTRPAGIAAVAVILLTMLVRGYRNAFRAPNARIDPTPDTDAPNGDI